MPEKAPTIVTPVNQEPVVERAPISRNVTPKKKEEAVEAPNAKKVSPLATPIDPVTTNKDMGMKSFVDILTIDYRKTLNDYRNKLMEGARNQAISANFQSAKTQKPFVSRTDSEASFVDCLKGDH